METKWTLISSIERCAKQRSHIAVRIEILFREFARSGGLPEQFQADPDIACNVMCRRPSRSISLFLLENMPDRLFRSDWCCSSRDQKEQAQSARGVFWSIRGLAAARSTASYRVFNTKSTKNHEGSRRKSLVCPSADHIRTQALSARKFFSSWCFVLFVLKNLACVRPIRDPERLLVPTVAEKIIAPRWHRNHRFRAASAASWDVRY
jgi:hypothetical protein